jgi:hypothetical protein
MTVLPQLQSELARAARSRRHGAGAVAVVLVAATLAVLSTPPPVAAAGVSGQPVTTPVVAA